MSSLYHMLFLKNITSLAIIQYSSDVIQKKKFNAIMTDFHKINGKNMTGYSRKMLKIHRVCNGSITC
jgi:hypothetical protein